MVLPALGVLEDVVVHAARLAGEGVDVGEDGETPVTEAYGTPAPHKFTGKIGKVTLTTSPMKPVEKAAADSAQKEAKLKKSLAD